MSTLNNIIVYIILLGLFSCTNKTSDKTSNVESQKEKEDFSYPILDSAFASKNVNTDTTVLSNGALLYYQINHDSLWLTLERKQKTTLFSTGFGLVDYHYRLDYHFYKEFNKYLLFRHGCPANGPCEFVLVDKSNGKEFKQLPELIYNHDTEFDEDYLIYFSDNREFIIFYNVDANTKFEFKHGIKDILTAITPEYEFDSIKRLPNRYDLFYGVVNNGKRVSKKLTVALKNTTDTR